VELRPGCLQRPDVHVHLVEPGNAVTQRMLGLMRDIYRRLMDATDPALIERAESLLRAAPGVASIDKVQLRWVGHRLHMEIAISADPSLSLIGAHEIAHEAEHALRHGIARLDEVHVHVGPLETSGPQFHTVIEHHRE